MVSLMNNQPLLGWGGQLKSKAFYFAIFLFLTLFLGLSPSVLAEKKFTHVVKKGDTLWDICEKYYADPFLWPELWEMNQFITNPHWVLPGDIITLLEYKEVKMPPAKKVVTVKKQPLEIKKPMGVDVSSFTNTKALGLLMQEIIVPWGKILDFNIEKMLHAEFETAYVKMYKEDITPGDIFTIYSISKPIRHPITRKKFGYIYSFKGILELGKAQEDYYFAKITESFKTIQKNDLLIPYHPVSPCMLPIPCQHDITAYIVAAKEESELLGQYSIIYIDAGSSKNIQKGNIFEAIQGKKAIGDKPTKEVITLPPTILGKVLILTTTENTSTGVVFWASKDFTNGVKVRSTSWNRQPEKFTNLSGCYLE